ncbi:MAG: hypothetical protein ACOCQ3_00880 [Natronomonas sp.]
MLDYLTQFGPRLEITTNVGSSFFAIGMVVPLVLDDVNRNVARVQ